jgi:hypothetical protein
MDLQSSLRFVREFQPASAWRYLKLVESPIMICGCGRSGTSMLLSMLGAHPKIQAIGIETNIYNNPRRFKSHRINHWNNSRKLADYLLRAPIKKTADRWCEKTPSNVRHIPELLAEFGDRLKLIHIIRDGRDVVTSIHPTKKGEYWVTPERWIQDVQLGLAYEDHPQMFTIRYENIVQDKEGSMKPLMDFLQLDLHPNVLEHNKKTTVRKINAWEGEVKAVYTSSVEKWKKPEHKKVVDELVEKQAPFQLLEKLGYTSS